MPYEGTGRYRHYKGGHYMVYGLAVDEEEKPEGDDNWEGVDPRVIYMPLSEGSILPSPHGAQLWGRKLSDFDQMVPSPNFPPDFVPRFVKLEALRVGCP